MGLLVAEGTATARRRLRDAPRRPEDMVGARGPGIAISTRTVRARCRDRDLRGRGHGPIQAGRGRGVRREGEGIGGETARHRRGGPEGEGVRVTRALVATVGAGAVVGEAIGRGGDGRWMGEAESEQG